ncbi:MAG: NAD-dependent epimerase/dehydratase family protein [Tepidisphaeraceae bacterium]|jgi:UDP-glucuronate 4-epimerase
MKVFLTGAAGFIGSRLAKAILQRGDEVVGLDNMNDYYPLEHKQRHLNDLIPENRFSFIRADLCDAPRIRELLNQHRPDAVAHLAAMAAVRYSVQHPLMYALVNVQGTVNLLDAARQIGKPRCILASTGSTYGKDTPAPFTETASADRPLAPYPASKRAMELFAHCYHHLWKLPTTILRFFNVYGPHGRPDMMPWQWATAIHRGQPITLYGAGKLKRDWTYIDDIVAGFLAALDKGLEYEILNLGCSQPVDNVQFVQILEELIGRKAEIIDTPTPASEPTITFADISKARKLLGYDPKITVREGLTRFIDWMRRENLL